MPLFAPLPRAQLEQLAHNLEPIEVAAGTTIIQQGDEGDNFYILGQGQLQLIVDDQPRGTLTAGDWFGEIALLRKEPRTATITATTPATLYALARGPFIATVTGHPESLAAADAAIASRLATIRPGLT